MTTTGFIGLGNMGRPMAANLIRAGHDLIVYDVRRDAAIELEALGARVADNPAEVGKNAQVIHVNVLTAAQVEDVLFAADYGALDSVANNRLVVLHSTVGPECCSRLEDLVGNRPIRLFDAPTTGGGSDAAARGELSLIVGGQDDDLRLLAPAFAAMATTVIHVGRFGQAQIAKLMNNLLAIVNSVVLEEALALSELTGMDDVAMLKVIAAGSGASFVAERRTELARMARRGTDGIEGQIAMSLKDLLTVLDYARAREAEVPLTTVAAQHLDRLFIADDAEGDRGD